MHRLFALILVGGLVPSLLWAQGPSARSLGGTPRALSAPASAAGKAYPLFGAQKNTAYGRGHTAKRTALQMVGGTYFGGMAGFLAFMFSGRAFSCGCPQSQSVDTLERLDTNFIKVGVPAAFTLVSSVAVYLIGHHVDQDQEGALVPTLGGGIAGAALGAGMVVGLHQASGDFPVGAFIASIFLPPLGGTQGYKWSMPAGDGLSHTPLRDETGFGPSRSIASIRLPLFRYRF